MDGALVGLDGVLSRPQLTSRLTAAPARIWSLAAAPTPARSGRWAATAGCFASAVRTNTPFDADVNNIFAVAVSGNRVYAASSPDGRVCMIEGSQPARPFFDPERNTSGRSPSMAPDACGLAPAILL